MWLAGSLRSPAVAVHGLVVPFGNAGGVKASSGHAEAAALVVQPEIFMVADGGRKTTAGRDAGELVCRICCDCKSVPSPGCGIMVTSGIKETTILNAISAGFGDGNLSLDGILQRGAGVSVTK